MDSFDAFVLICVVGLVDLALVDIRKGLMEVRGALESIERAIREGGGGQDQSHAGR